MSGRKEFLLGNVPNRVSHAVASTVIIVNTADAEADRGGVFRRAR
jgi:nucleotide-binding universal stress UspA family protein